MSRVWHPGRLQGLAAWPPSASRSDGYADAAPGNGGGNRLLAAMPRRETQLLGTALAPFRLEPGAVVAEPDRSIEHVVFPDSGVVSILMGSDGPGERAEVGLVGREGLLGLHALFGGRAAPFLAVVQVGGEARRAPARALRPLLHGSFAFRDLVLRCAAAQLADAACNAACNALHPLRRRTARWLLAVHDRVGPGFFLTQACLADMLGARRPTMNAVLQQLKAEGLIRTARGRIAITDAAALEGAACACRRRALDARRDLLAVF
jgi:CRP-like cAMP-binding protein